MSAAGSGYWRWRQRRSAGWPCWRRVGCWPASGSARCRAAGPAATCEWVSGRRKVVGGGCRRIGRAAGPAVTCERWMGGDPEVVKGAGGGSRWEVTVVARGGDGAGVSGTRARGPQTGWHAGRSEHCGYPYSRHLVRHTHHHHITTSSLASSTIYAVITNG